MKETSSNYGISYPPFNVVDASIHVGNCGEIRFLGCLHNANVVNGADFAKVLKKLLEVLVNEEFRQVDKDHIAHIVMSGIAFVC